MNNNQQLRFIITEYGNMLWIDDLYTKYKKVLSINNASKLDDNIKESMIGSFKLWIKDLQQNPERKEIVYKQMCDKLKKN